MRPLFCNYFLTLKCELVCNFCPFWERYEDYPEEAPLEVNLKNLKILSEAGIKFINFSGGDPFLYFGFSEVVKKAKKLGFIISVSSSGIHYQEVASELKGKIDFLCFELSGHSQEKVTDTSGFDFFEKILESIKLSRKLKENSFIKFVVNRDNVLFLQEIVELAMSLGTPLILRPSLKDDEISNFSQETFAYIKRYFNHPAVFLNWALFEFQKKIQSKKQIQRKICRAGQYIVTILPNGELVYPCFYRPNYKIKLDDEKKKFIFLSGFQRKENSREIQECLTCRDWDYFEPSFFYGLNRYNWFNIISWGKYYLKKNFSRYFRS